MLFGRYISHLFSEIRYDVPLPASGCYANIRERRGRAFEAQQQATGKDFPDLLVPVFHSKPVDVTGFSG